MKKSRLLLPSFLLPTLLLLGFQFQGTYRNASTSSLPYTQEGNAQWYTMNDDARISVSEFLQNHKEDLGLNSNEAWVNYRTETDQLGITHYRFQLHHAGQDTLRSRS